MNRKIYRHKPTGELFRQTNTLEIRGMEDMESDGLTLPIWLVEQSDDWEEVKEEPNYLITAFRDLRQGRDNILYKINSEGNYTSGSGFPGIPLIKMLKVGDCVQSGHFAIYSVKNSKGEEFTIGDSVMCEKEKFTISHFNIGYTDINIMMAVFNETNTKLNNLNGSNIELISKPKSPIYTTTDGVDIKEGSHLVLYLVNKELNTLLQNVAVINNFSKEDAEVASRYLTFTSEENRDKYIKENTKKPVFVSEDGVELFEEPEYVYSVLTKGLWPMERNYFYNHKYKSPEWKHFVTKEARQEYIDNNKPKYSLADIKKAYEEAFDETFTEIEIELKKLGK